MIHEKSVVTMTYVLRDDNRLILDASIGEPFMILMGANNIIPGLEKALLGLGVGERKAVTVPSIDAYGEYNPALQMTIPRQQFGGENPEVGRQVQLSSSSGPFIATIIKLDDQNVYLDANHPLAGKTLHFEVDILGIRDASLEELSHGHAHDPSNPHHHH